ncbi:MAG: hypothetical protein NTU61_00310 [Candidatus Altiarchaeota archaeon]|nr:hypothetical protein [Candidatus Altiarchaeota archaeon]
MNYPLEVPLEIHNKIITLLGQGKIKSENGFIAYAVGKKIGLHPEILNALALKEYNKPYNSSKLFTEKINKELGFVMVGIYELSISYYYLTHMESFNPLYIIIAILLPLVFPLLWLSAGIINMILNHITYNLELPNEIVRTLEKLALKEKIDSEDLFIFRAILEEAEQLKD